VLSSKSQRGILSNREEHGFALIRRAKAELAVTILRVWRHLVKIEHARAHESESNAPQDGIAPPMLVDALREINQTCPLCVHPAGSEVSHAQHLEIVVEAVHAAAAPCGDIVAHVASALTKARANMPLPLRDEVQQAGGAEGKLLRLLQSARCPAMMRRRARRLPR